LNLSEKEVRYVADLANLRLTGEEVVKMSHDLGNILTHIEQLNELDTAAVQPMAQVLFEADETAALREDVVRTPLGNSDALANAPRASSGYFKVPKVIER
jgi:aspartyl-tRNA(Asn)/glutamyl-tRNA(Gln) amidotransferase subunit C